MRGVGVCLDVVGVDVEGDEAEGLEAGRIHDGHVVGGVDAGRGHVGPGRAADVEQPLAQDALPDQLDQALVVETLEQLEGVAAADEDGLGVPDRLSRVGRSVDGGEPEAPGLELLPSRRGVVVLLSGRETEAL